MYRELRSIYPTMACRQFLDSLQQLEQECGYGEDRIPQLRDVSAFLKGERVTRGPPEDWSHWRGVEAWPHARLSLCHSKVSEKEL